MAIKKKKTGDGKTAQMWLNRFDALSQNCTTFLFLLYVDMEFPCYPALFSHPVWMVDTICTRVASIAWYMCAVAVQTFCSILTKTVFMAILPVRFSPRPRSGTETAAGGVGPQVDLLSWYFKHHGRIRYCHLERGESLKSLCVAPWEGENCAIATRMQVSAHKYREAHVIPRHTILIFVVCVRATIFVKLVFVRGRGVIFSCNGHITYSVLKCMYSYSSRSLRKSVPPWL